MRYAEYPPHPSLGAFVRCYWVLEAPAAGTTDPPERIVPDGCTELIVHHGTPYCRCDENGTPVAAQKRAVFAGQIERPLLLRQTGAAGMFAVRFQPAGARPFVRLPLGEIRGRVVELADVWGPTAHELEDRLLGARSDAERIFIVEAALFHILAQRDPRPDAVDEAAAGIVASQGRISVDGLARKLRVGRRRLERGFRDRVGLSPKLLARIVRVQTVLSRMDGRSSPGWAHLALDCGYYDQAHLIRDFRAFTGLSPTRYLAQNHPMTDLFVEASASGGARSV